MKTRSFLTALVLPLFFVTQAPGAEEQPDPKLPLWQASLDDSSMVTIAVSQLVSVTMHPYLLNGENLVTEVTIDTTGNNTIRFYYVHPEEDKLDLMNPEKTVKNAKKKILRRPSQPKANSIASVKFPEGAYAHSIEYQVNSLDDLEKIYQSLISVWEKSSKKRTIYTPPTTENE